MNFRTGSAAFKCGALAALILSLAISTVFDESSIADSRELGLIARLMGALVPAVRFFNQISTRPHTFAVLYAINWLFVPVYLAGICVARPVWQLNSIKVLVRSLRRQKPQAAVGRTMFFVAMFCLYVVLSDIGAVRGPGPYSMNMSGGLVYHSHLFRPIDGSGFSIALFSWIYCMLDAVCYYFVGAYAAYLYFATVQKAELT
ncbi:hypothetical protein HAV22_04665 [Massilia sp. TW-1]|uniref:Uncharacterized protein n=1 Tax=Telluria antibiotica TaxID=2717319 RepID=A0ABX0P9T5_9BURK|nr:hypothetical protein [Telluria antibiotica]NIA52945.1 hypothetical protein [Telluria antibiotica]